MRARPARLPLAVAAAVSLAVLAGCSAPAPASGPVPRSAPVAPAAVSPESPAAAAPTAVVASSFDLEARSIDDPASLWVVVNKRRPLRQRTYVPPDLVTPAVRHTNVPRLRKAAASALTTMFAAAKRDGVTLVSLSAYRSYASQKAIFERNLRRLGTATTLDLTAKPGYSEHQTGLADDLGDGTSCDLQVCFRSHAAARWLAAHSWRYGWILRYPLGLTRITGIQTEPWHFRYVGRPLAGEMHRTGVRTLEQLFDLPPAPRY